MATRLIEDIGIPAPEPGVAEPELLQRVGLVLNSTLELKEVLKRLAEITRELLGAERCSIFLLEGDRLEPAVCIGRFPDEDLWTAFRSMGSIDLDSVPFGREKLERGRAVGIEDALASAFVPDEWVARFGVRSVALTPLLVAGSPCGLMAVDQMTERRFRPEELRLLEAIGCYAGVAIRNARLFEKTHRRALVQEVLARAAGDLIAPLHASEVVDRLVDAYSRLLGARLCAVGLFQDDFTKIDAVATRGTARSLRSVQAEEVPRHIIDRIFDEWTRGPRVLEFVDEPWFADFLGGGAVGASKYLLLPLIVEKRIRGAVLMGFGPSFVIRPEELSAAKALAAIASAALERSALVERNELRLRRVEVLHDLSSALTERFDAATIVSKLNGLLTGHRFEVLGLAFRDRKLARRLGGAELTDAEQAVLRSKTGCLTLPDGTLGVRMKLGRRHIGVMRVAPSDLAPDERSFVEALAGGVAEVASRGALRATVEDANRERAVAEERGRIAADLHDTAGQIFVAISLLAHHQGEQLPPDSPWSGKFRRLAELAERGKWEINQAVQALAFFPAGRRGIVPSLKSLTRSFESDSGIQVLLDVTGSTIRLSPRIERALYRVAHEALTNAWRHARCSTIRLELAFDRPQTSMVIVDDGTGVRPDQEGPRVGIANMRRAMDEVDGSLRIKNVKPHGLRVEASVPSEAA